MLLINYCFETNEVLKITSHQNTSVSKVVSTPKKYKITLKNHLFRFSKKLVFWNVLPKISFLKHPSPHKLNAFQLFLTPKTLSKSTITTETLGRVKMVTNRLTH